MQRLDWDDLKFFLALTRSGKLTDAGRLLRTNETTVSRRVKRLETELGATLITRTHTGRYEVTDLGRAIAAHAAIIESETIAISALAGQAATALTGTVRISAVPIIINHVLAPALGDLRARHPALQIELAPESRNIDLTRREADLALRFARPTAGGLANKTQKLGALAFGVFAPAATTDAHDLGWIAYDDAHASLPQERWRRSIAGSHAPICLRVSDAETALAAVRNGLGKAILPICVGAVEQHLREITAQNTDQQMTRDVWMLSHKDQVTRASVEAVKQWVLELPWR